MTRMILVEAVAWIATRDVALCAKVRDFTGVDHRGGADEDAFAAAWIELVSCSGNEAVADAKSQLLSAVIDDRVKCVGTAPGEDLSPVPSLAFEGGFFGNHGLHTSTQSLLHVPRWAHLRFDRDAVLSLWQAETPLREGPRPPIKRASPSLIRAETRECFDKGLDQTRTFAELMRRHAPMKVGRDLVRKEYNDYAARCGKVVRPGPKVAE